MNIDRVAGGERFGTTSKTAGMWSPAECYQISDNYDAIYIIK